MINGWILLFVGIAILISVVGKYWFYKTATWAEIALFSVVGVAILTGSFYMMRHGVNADHEIINGQVTTKRVDKVDCEHSYSCNCRTVKSGNSTTTQCDTCYEHSHDYDWLIVTTVGKLKVERVDDQGVNKPPRWEAAQAGQPVARWHKYQNYIKSSADTIMGYEYTDSPLMKLVPTYPAIYDLHYADRVIPVGMTLPNKAEWNGRLALALRTLGADKQANVIMIVTNEKSPMFAKAVMSAWAGAKKNDVVVVVGAANYPAVDWVSVHSWSKTDMVNVSLRNRIMDQKTLHPERTISLIDATIREYYQRRPMSDFEYLRDSADPPTWMLVVMTLLSIVVGVGVLFMSHVVDLFNSSTFGSRGYPTRPARGFGNRPFQRRF